MWAAKLVWLATTWLDIKQLVTFYPSYDSLKSHKNRYQISNSGQTCLFDFHGF